jgi:hypothetical protein
MNTSEGRGDVVEASSVDRAAFLTEGISAAGIIGGVSTTAWSAYDEGYLEAYQWSGLLATGNPLPQVATAVPLGPGEVAHAHIAPVGIFGYFGEQKEYNRSLFLFGGPVGLAVTGAASMAHNASKKAEAERAAIPHWHGLGSGDLVMTNQRLAVTLNGNLQSLWHAESGALGSAVGAGGVPAVQLQPNGMPPLRLESPSAPTVFVFVHHLLEGRPPAVPMPADLLDRARAQGRLAPG